MNLIETTAGIPNTCCVCGQDPGDSWFAENNEQAVVGQGYCAKDADKVADNVQRVEEEQEEAKQGTAALVGLKKDDLIAMLEERELPTDGNKGEL